MKLSNTTIISGYILFFVMFFLIIFLLYCYRPEKMLKKDRTLNWNYMVAYSFLFSLIFCVTSCYLSAYVDKEYILKKTLEQ